MKYHRPVQWSQNYRFGGNAAPTVLGMSTAFNWTSDPWDSDDGLISRVDFWCPSGATPAMVVIPSTTAIANGTSPYSTCGILLVATALGVAGNSATLTIATPGSAARYVSVSGTDITVTPQTGDTVQTIVNLLNAPIDSTGAAIVAQLPFTAYAWGYVFAGPDPWSTTNVAPMITAQTDVVVAAAKTNLIGGSATSNQTGQLFVESTSDPVNIPWIQEQSGASVPGGSQKISIPVADNRWYRARWGGSGTPTGQLYAVAVTKGQIR